MLLLENIPLAPLTTIKVGGPARYFVEAKDVAEALEAVSFARSRDLPLFVLGGGSNLIVADAGWPGVVLKIAIQGIDQLDQPNEKGNILFQVGAGESWDKFVSRAVMARCAGVECLIARCVNSARRLAGLATARASSVLPDADVSSFSALPIH